MYQDEFTVKIQCIHTTIKDQDYKYNILTDSFKITEVTLVQVWVGLKVNTGKLKIT